MIHYRNLSKDEKNTMDLQIVSLSKQGMTANQIAAQLDIDVANVYYKLDVYRKKNPQERAHITMRINKLGKENVSRKEGKVFKNVTTTKVLTYGVHSIILDDNTPRKIYLKANGDIHVE